MARNLHGVGGGLDDGRDRRRGAGHRREDACRGDVQEADAVREHVVLVDARLVETEPGDEFGDVAFIARAAAELNAACVGDVCCNFRRLEVDTPGPKELRQFSAARALLLHEFELCRLRKRIDEDKNLTALESELIDRVGRFRRELRRLRNHEHIDGLRDFGCRLIDGFDVEELADLGHDRPGWRRASAALLFGPRCLTAIEGQRRDEACHALLRIGESVDELRQIVFDEVLAVGFEEAHDLAVCRSSWWRKVQSSRLRLRH